MKSGSLLSDISQKLHKTKILALANIASKSNYSVKELIDLTFYHDHKIGFRASWILEYIYTLDIERFLPFAPYFLQQFCLQENPSCRRHFSKILALMTDKKAHSQIKSLIHSYNSDEIIETLFSWLITENQPVAIKVHSLTALSNFCEKHDWVRDELIQTINFLSDKESIAFYSRAKQIKKKLSP